MIALLVVLGVLVVAALVGGVIVAVHESDARSSLNNQVGVATAAASARLPDATGSHLDPNGVASRLSGLADVLDELPAIANAGTRGGLPTVAFIVATLLALAAGTVAIVDRIEARQALDSCYRAFQGSAVVAATTTTPVATTPTTAPEQETSTTVGATGTTSSPAAAAATEPSATPIAAPIVASAATPSVDAAEIIRACRAHGDEDRSHSRRDDSRAVARVLAHTASTRVPLVGETVYRVSSTNADRTPTGTSWTPVDPRVIEVAFGQNAYREFAGLPDANAGTFLQICVVKDPAGITERAAIELGSSRWEPGEENPGGLVEYVIGDAKKTLENCSSAEVKPPL